MAARWKRLKKWVEGWEKEKELRNKMKQEGESMKGLSKQIP